MSPKVSQCALIHNSEFPAIFNLLHTKHKIIINTLKHILKHFKLIISIFTIAAQFSRKQTALNNQ